MNVLFLCLGNICRSPMAEAVFTHIVKEKGIIDKFKIIDSAGTAGYHIDEYPDPRTIDICKENGVDINHTGKQLSVQHFETFDWILCMDESNLQNALAKKPKNSKAKLILFGDFDSKGERIIQDPYYGGRDGFQRNFDQVQRCSIGFLTHLNLLVN